MSDTGGSNIVGKTLTDVRHAGEAARQVGDQARQVGADALSHAKDVGQEVQSRAAGLAGTLGDQAMSTAEAQKDDLASKIEDVAKAVHRSGEQFEGNQDWIAHIVERGAAELSTLASTLRTNDLRGLMGGLEDLARRQPALFVGASLAAGFALTRVGRVAVAGASKADLPTMPEVTRERQ